MAAGDIPVPASQARSYNSRAPTLSSLYRSLKSIWELLGARMSEANAALDCCGIDPVMKARTLFRIRSVHATSI
jgi:hypothetical protein